MPNKEQSQSARGTQLYLQTVCTSRTLAGSGIEQMDDKSVSNEGKLAARCQCQGFGGSSANLFISVFTLSQLQDGEQEKTANRQDDQSRM